MCVDHGTYYKFYFKKLKSCITAHVSYTNCSLNMNIYLFNSFLLQKMDEENKSMTN